MAERQCSCCGQGYTDDIRHDYETCVKNCQDRVDRAKHEFNEARDCLEMAVSRRQAQRDGRIK